MKMLTLMLVVLITAAGKCIYLQQADEIAFSTIRDSCNIRPEFSSLQLGLSYIILLHYELGRTSSMKDLGVIIDCKLKFQDHIKQKNKQGLQYVRHSQKKFQRNGRRKFYFVIQSILRCHLEYAESVWNPHYMYLIDDMEKVQKRATKILRQCRRLNYRQRRKCLNLPTLAFRRNIIIIIIIFVY